MVESSGPRENSKIDFAQIADQFNAKDKSYFQAPATEVADGLAVVDKRLRSSRGELIFVAYSVDGEDSKKFAYGIGRTNGQGLRVSRNRDSGLDQIEFGSDAVMQESDINGSKSLTQTPTIVIPEGASLRLFTDSERFRSFLVGEEEIKKQANISGINHAAHFAFMLEQAGVSPREFLEDYFNADRIPGGTREKAEFDLQEQIGIYREAYGVDSPTESESKPDSPSVRVQTISLEQGLPFVEENGLLIDLRMKLDPELVSRDKAKDTVDRVKYYLGEDPFVGHIADKAYYLSWEGSAVPRGARMHGREVAYSQNGLVIDAQGEFMGNYINVVESGGEDGKRQEMIVYMNNFQMKDRNQRSSDK